MRWACGLTTCAERAKTLLPLTLEALWKAGFEDIQVFADGCEPRLGWVVRWPTIKPFGNFILGLVELFIRNRDADYYAMFQDDLVACKNLRLYLEQTFPTTQGYLNLYTAFAANERLIQGKPKGWHEASILNNGEHKNRFQTGRGALGLVFPKKAVITLLDSGGIGSKVMDQIFGYRKVDGWVVTAMNTAGYREWIHNPSLVQHKGLTSSIPGQLPHPQAQTFPGEDFDCLTLLREWQQQ